MRLTLRTLLAYRDGVLSPENSEDLHRRIQQSEDAGNLLKRIHAVSKRLHGESSTIVGKGLGGDPNSIAEYLDDVIHGEKVPEFERICLESDVRLGELASCHSLLSSAMHTRVHVPQSLRELSAAIGDANQLEQIKADIKSRRQQLTEKKRGRILRADQAHDDAMQGQTTTDDEQTEGAEHVVNVQAPMVASGGETIKPQGLNLEGSALAHEVPEYLMGASKGAWRIPLAIGALLALLAVLVWQTLGPWDRIAAMFAAKPNNTEASNTKSHDSPAASTAKDDSASEPGDAAIENLNEADASNTENRNPPDKLAAPDDDPVVPSVESPEVATGEAESSAVPPSTGDASATALASPLGGIVWLPKDEIESASVLLTSNNGELGRLSPGDSAATDTQLVIPPNYRTTIDLPGGILWTTGGASRLHVVDPEQAVLASDLCRGLIRSGPDGNLLRLQTPAGAATIQLAGPGSMASVEVTYRMQRHGSLLEPDSYRSMLLVVAVEGSVQLETYDATGAIRQTNLALGEGMAVFANSTPKKFKLQSIPQWFRASFDRPIDALAAEDLSLILKSSATAPADDLGQLLTSLHNGRRPETVALAVQTSLLLGNWEPLEIFLANERMRSHWGKTIDLARQLIAADPQRSEELHARLVASNPKGDKLFNMLIGFPGTELSVSGLSDLIGELNEGDLPSRVLASYQLRLLTGKSLGYQAHTSNRASIQQWRRELATDRLKLRDLGDVIWERVAR